MTRKGFLFIVFPLMLVLTALGVALSGRDLTRHYLELEREVEAIGPVGRAALLAWAQRAVSLLLVLVSMERIVSHLVQRKPLPSGTLTWSFLFYWLTTVAATAVLATHTRISHEYLYPLVLGLACTLVTPEERDRILDAVRTGLILFLIAGWLLVPVNTTLVLDLQYSQGFLPGVPRFGGLASHPVMLGMLAQTALIVLWVRPYQRGWVNASAWLIGLGALFLAQSKSAWLAFLISACCLVFVRRAQATVQRMGDPRRSSFGVGMCLLVILVAVLAFLSLLVFDLPGLLDSFLSTSEGAQLASLTGRDRIWVVAMEEWQRNPVFGYGLTLWDADYRQEIQMPFATHAHNQFLDTMARSGMVGLVGLVVYFVTLMVLSIRHARATGGLSLAFFLTLALLCISEVPLILIDYGSHVLTHFLLILTVASGAAARARVRPVPVQRIDPTFRTAT